ncbi:hypothetical protein [Rhodohalobacter sp. 614A]|uniref:hypothetical protein n=1 Tax=Rhodohalobacter sp. 614A TaxID=2908649 RepID=UPI001F1B0803|nr:hypothetical protein [Rhodohalobacter sp. 614A]
MQIQKNYNRYTFSIVYVVFCFAILFYMHGLIDNKPIVSDAVQNLRMAYHLYNSGVLSNENDTTVVPEPTNYREPIPPIVTAAFIALHPGLNKVTLQSLQSGEHTKKIKQVDLFWILLLLIGVGFLSYSVTANKWVPFLALFFILIYFIRFGGHFGTLFTELPAAALIIWSSYFLLIAVKWERLFIYFIAGLSLGLLILIKAVFYYLFLVLLLVFIFGGTSEKKPVKVGLLFFGAFIVVGPWLIRNYYIYGEVGITQRGGVVLYQRAEHNMMTKEEVNGAIYLWGPEIYRSIVRDSFLGFKESDFESGGKLVRLNRDLESDSAAVDDGRPELAESFFNKSRAEVNRLQTEMGRDGQEASRRDVYNFLQGEAKEMILNHPVRHVLMSPVFLWRGIWCFPNSTIPLFPDTLQRYLHDVVNLLAYLSLWSFFIFGLIKFDRIYMALTILPVLMLLFHAGATHNIPRFSDPAIPSMLICLSILFFYVIRKSYNNLFTTLAKKRTE